MGEEMKEEGVGISKDLVVDQPEPKEVVEFGRKSAVLLKEIIDAQKDKVIIKGEQYLQFSDWQTIARFYRTTVGTEWSRVVQDGDNILGYEAKANAIDFSGRVISSAESSCFFDEPNWKDKPLFQLRSMAQTRACGKVLRNIFSWVIVLAGYDPNKTAFTRGSNGDVHVEKLED